MIRHVMKLAKYILLTIVFLYTIFPFYIKEVYQLNYLIFNVGIIVYCIANYKCVLEILSKLPLIKQKVKFFELAWILLCLFTLIIVVAAETYDFGFFKFVFGIQRDFFRALALVIIVYKNHPVSRVGDMFYNYYMVACVIYIIVSCYMLFDPSFRLTWIDIVESQANAKAEFLASGTYIKEITRIGLQGYSGIWCSLNCSLGVILSVFYITDCLSKRKNVSSIYFLGIIFMLLGNLFYGRTGFIISIVSLFVGLIYVFKYKRKLCTKMVIYFLIASALFIGVSSSIPEAEEWKKWSLEPYEKIQAFVLEDDEFSLGGSGDDLMTMYHLPSYDILFHGEGYFALDSMGDYDYKSDIGWYRVTYFGGLIGTFLYYSCFFIMLYIYIGFAKINNYYNIILLLLMIGTSFFIFELKGSNMNTHLGYIVMTSCFLLQEVSKGDRNV